MSADTCPDVQLDVCTRVVMAADTWTCDQCPDVQLDLTTVTYVWNVTCCRKYHVFMIVLDCPVVQQGGDL